MNRNFLNRILTNNYHYTPNHPDFRKAFLLNGMLVLFLFLMLTAGMINFLFGDYYYVYYTQLSASVISFGILIHFRRSNNLRLTSTLFIVMVFVVSGVFLYFARNLAYSFYWLSLVPFLFYFVADRKHAVFATIAFFVVIGVMMLHKPFDDAQNINYLSVTNIGMASIIVVLLLVQFDLSGVYVSKALAEQNAKLKELSETDPLTGMYNRLKINGIIEENINKCNESDRKFSIIMSDIDGFKGINDRFGHLVGDKVLVAISDIFKGYAREGCISGRWGGEEFIFICCDMEEQEAAIIAEELKNKISSYHILDDEMTSMSFGVATYEKGDDFERLIHRADTALYKAKASGGGCVVAYKRNFKRIETE